MSFLNILSTAFNLQKNCISSARQTLFKLDFLITAKQDLPLVSHCVNSLRYRKLNNDRVFRKIRGGGRPLPEGIVPPEPRKYGWRPLYPEDGKYTTKPLPIIKMGGRHPETGRVVVRTIGGGHKKFFYWVDYKREGPADGSLLEERVFKIEVDPVRTARVALVGNGDHKRWIIAAESTKVGDIVKTLGVIPRMPVRPVDGDAYPVGALPMGTVIHHIEVSPGGGAIFCRAAGTGGQYIRRVDNKCLVQLPSKRQLLLDEKCMVVAGKASNITHGSIPIGSPQQMRWLGKRPRSGLWHRKDGYCGRKINPPKSILDTFAPRQQLPEFYNLTFKK